MPLKEIHSRQFLDACVQHSIIYQHIWVPSIATFHLASAPSAATQALEEHVYIQVDASSSSSLGSLMLWSRGSIRTLKAASLRLGPSAPPHMEWLRRLQA